MFSNKKVKRNQKKYSGTNWEYFRIQHDKYKTVCEKVGNASVDTKNACHYLGRFYESVKPDKQSLSIAGRYFKMNCESNKSGESCLKLGTYFSEGIGGFQRDTEKAECAFNQACDLGEGEGCYLAGLLFFKSSTDLSKQKWRVAEKRFMQGCALNNGRSCEALSAVYRRGLVPGKRMIFMRNYSITDLFSSNQHSMEKDNANLWLLLKDTEKLASQCRKALGVENRLKETEKMEEAGRFNVDLNAILRISNDDAMNLSFGCLSGKIKNIELCHRLSEWMIPRNTEMGSLMFDQNCSNGSGESCLQLGKIFMQGVSRFPRDHERAADAFEKACYLGESEGCTRAGIMRSGPYYQCEKRDVLAERLLTKGCALNDEKSCVQLSALHHQRDRNRASEYDYDHTFHGSQLKPAWLNRSLTNSMKKLRCEFGEFEMCAKLSELCKQIPTT